MEQKPDFKKAYILANDMLVAAHCILNFPFDAAEFVKEQTDLKFYTYKKALEKFGLDCRALGSDSSVLAKCGGWKLPHCAENKMSFKLEIYKKGTCNNNFRCA